MVIFRLTPLLLSGLLVVCVVMQTSRGDTTDSTTKLQAVGGNCQPASLDWPVGRGNAQATGVAGSTLPAQLLLRWKHQVPHGAFEATAVIANHRVHVGDGDGVLHTFQLTTGKELWRFATDSGFGAAAAVQQGRVYAGDLDGVFYCLDASNGSLLWTFQAKAEIDGGANFAENSVLFGSQDATLYSLEATTGKVLWTYSIDDQIRCSPTIIQGRAFLAGCDGKLHIINVQKGLEEATVDVHAPTGSTPAARGSYVFFGTEAATFFCIDWKTKKIIWTFRNPHRHQPFRSSAALDGNRLVFGGRDRIVRAIDPESGEPVWSYPTRGRVDGSPVISGQRVFVGSADGRLYGLNLATGDNVWQFDAGGSFIASPAVAEGCLVIGNEDGTLYCFGGS